MGSCHNLFLFFSNNKVRSRITSRFRTKTVRKVDHIKSVAHHVLQGLGLPNQHYHPSCQNSFSACLSLAILLQQFIECTAAPDTWIKKCRAGDCQHIDGILYQNCKRCLLSASLGGWIAWETRLNYMEPHKRKGQSLEKTWPPSEGVIRQAGWARLGANFQCITQVNPYGHVCQSVPRSSKA